MINESIVGKIFLLGLMVSATSGTAVSAIDFGNEDLVIFSASMWGGTIGTFVSLAVYGASDMRSLARHAVTNSGLAVLFGPFLAWGASKITGAEMTIYLIIGSSGAIGIGGMAVLKAVGPVIVDSLKSGVGGMIEAFFKSRSVSNSAESGSGNSSK